MNNHAIQYYSLRIFLLCLFVTATLFLFALWFLEHPVEFYFKTMATFFVVGFTSFLVWFVGILIQIKTQLEKGQ